MKARRQRNSSDEAATRARLLDAASEVFAEAGFRNATVREIVQRAGVNIAAINYHFGDKESLYAEVLDTAYARALEKYPPNMGLAPSATAEQRLQAFIRAFLLRVFDSGPHSHHAKLMAREMVEPTAALDQVVHKGIGSQARTLMGIVRELMGPRASDRTIRTCSMSIVSQVIFYHTCRPVIGRMFPDMEFGPKEVEQLAAHITRFSLAALANYRAPGRK